MQRTICGLSRLGHDATHRFRPTFGAIPFLGPRHQRDSYLPRHRWLIVLTKGVTSVVHVSDGGDSEALLKRCQPYGITTLAELDRQSDHSLKSSDSELLVDSTRYRSDLRLWEILLDYRIHYYGSKGAATIWRGLKYGDPRINLDAEEPLTATIWRKLLRSAAHHGDLVLTRRLIEHDGIAWNRPKLFAEILSTFIRDGQHQQLRTICRQVRWRKQDGTILLRNLFEDLHPQSPEELQSFCFVYELFGPGQIYGTAVSSLLEQNRPDEALKLHRFLISRGDFPTAFSDIEPFMRHFAMKSEDPGPFLRSLSTTGVFFTGQGRYFHERQSWQIATNVDGRLPVALKAEDHPPANRVSDYLAAKAFATKALSFEFVLNALQAFGLTEIGPQSLRQIGLAAGDLTSLSSRLTSLDQLRIDTGGSAYSRFVRKVCSAKEHALLRQALHTDMHHDVFEDLGLQQRLLVECVNKCNWPQVNLLLAMLSHKQVTQLSGSVKFVLLKPLVNDASKARSLLTALRSMGGAATSQSLEVVKDLSDHLLSRLAAHRPDRTISRYESRSRIVFMACVLQDCVAAGVNINARQWKLVFSRLHQVGAFEESMKLAIWLSVLDSERVVSLTTNEHIPSSQSHLLKWVLDHKFQSATVHWALREQFYGAGRVRHPWQTTLEFLKYLERSCHIAINLHAIRTTVVLFARGLNHRPSYAPRNRATDTREIDSRRLCMKLLRTVDQMWPRKLMRNRYERQVAVRVLQREEADDTVAVARPTIRTALRRLPVPRKGSQHLT